MKSRSEIELKYSESLQILSGRVNKLSEGKNEWITFNLKLKTSKKIKKNRHLKNALDSLESYFAIHSDLSKSLSSQINSDIVPALLNYIKNEKDIIKNMELTGRQCEKSLNEVMETYEKVYSN